MRVFQPKIRYTPLSQEEITEQTLYCVGIYQDAITRLPEDQVWRIRHALSKIKFPDP